MASIKHINIVSYKESFYDEENKYLYVVMECAEKGDLSK